MVDIRDHLKCPICFEIPKDKMFQCRNGHRFCENCYKKFKEKSCPQCKDHIPKNPIRCKAVEELLDSFGLEFPCQFQDAGCEVKMRRRTIGDHSSTCKYDFKKFGPLENVCGFFGFSNCSFTFNRGSIDEAFDHFKERHKMRSIKALLSKQFTIQYEDFGEIFNFSETTVFTPLIFDQRWWGHNFIYIIVIRFNPHDKTLQFVTFYLTHGLILWDGSKGFSEEVKFTFDFTNSCATVQPQFLLNPNGRTLKDATYIAAPLNSEMSFDKENSTPLYSHLQIEIRKENTPQPPKDVRDDDGLTEFTTFKPTDIFTPFLLNMPWPPIIREVCLNQGPKNWDQVVWIPWNEFGGYKKRLDLLFAYHGMRVFICRANVDEKWLIGGIHMSMEMKRNSIAILFHFPFLLESEESFHLHENFEILYVPPKTYEWVAWKDAKGMEAVQVHDDDKSLLICRWKKPSLYSFGALGRNMELDNRDDIDVLVFTDKEKEEGEHKRLFRGKGFPCARGLKRHNKREHKKREK